MTTIKQGVAVVGGVEVGGYVVERAADGTLRACFWGALALLAAQAELDAAIRVSDAGPALDTVGVEVGAADFVSPDC